MATPPNPDQPCNQPTYNAQDFGHRLLTEHLTEAALAQEEMRRAMASAAAIAGERLVRRRSAEDRGDQPHIPRLLRQARAISLHVPYTVGVRRFAGGEFAVCRLSGITP